MSTTLQTEEIEIESREMNIWICMECECWSQELDSEVQNVRCGNCLSWDVRVARSFMYEQEAKNSQHDLLNF